MLTLASILSGVLGYAAIHGDSRTFSFLTLTVGEIVIVLVVWLNQTTNTFYLQYWRYKMEKVMKRVK
ncbi:MAG: hypothetical protein Q7T49_03030 [bacterium]|nr:hypothetical protein [bacterium]